MTSKLPRTLQKKGQEVRIYEGFDKLREKAFLLSSITRGRRVRTTRRSLRDAEELAREALDQMVRNRVPVSLTPEDWELLKKVKKVAGERSPWRLLEDTRAATKLLAGSASMTEAAEFFTARNQHRAKVTVGEIFDNYITHLEQNAGERNLSDVRSRVGRFEQTFRRNALADISRDAIREFIKGLDVSNRTRNNYRQQIITFFRWAQKRGYLRRGPPDRAGIPRPLARGGKGSCHLHRPANP